MSFGFHSDDLDKEESPADKLDRQISDLRGSIIDLYRLVGEKEKEIASLTHKLNHVISKLKTQTDLLGPREE